MSFSVITLTPPVSVPSQIVTASSGTVNNNTENFVMLNEGKTALCHREIDVNKYHGEAYLISNTTAITPATLNVYQDVSTLALTLDNAVSTADFDMPTNGVLRYIGTKNNVLFRFSANVSTYISAGTETYGMRCATVSGVTTTPIPKSTTETTLRTNTQGTENMKISCIVKLSQNDAVKLQIASITANTNIILKHVVISLESI